MNAKIAVIAVSLLGLLSIEASAGYRCRSECVVINQADARIYFLGVVAQEGDIDRDDLFDIYLEGSCQQKAAREGLNGNAILIKHVAFQSSRHDDSTKSSSNAVRVSGYKADIKRGRHLEPNLGGNDVEYAYDDTESSSGFDNSTASSSYSREVHDKKFNAEIFYADPENSCRYKKAASTPYYIGNGDPQG